MQKVDNKSKAGAKLSCKIPQKKNLKQFIRKGMRVKLCLKVNLFYFYEHFKVYESFQRLLQSTPAKHIIARWNNRALYQLIYISYASFFFHSLA